MPSPCRAFKTPRVVSALSASRSELRETPSLMANSLSLGSLSPGLISPDMMSCFIWDIAWLVTDIGSPTFLSSAFARDSFEHEYEMGPDRRQVHKCVTVLRPETELLALGSEVSSFERLTLGEHLDAQS